jgi:plastocyanin
MTAAPALAVTHVIPQSGFAWSPDLVVINVGDTVQWVRASFSHTVISDTLPATTAGVYVVAVDAAGSRESIKLTLAK